MKLIFKAEWLKNLKKLDIQSIKVKLLIKYLISMDDLKRRIKSRSKNTLFNPYKNGISPYDLAYLSSKKDAKKKTNFLQKARNKDYFAA